MFVCTGVYVCLCASYLRACMPACLCFCVHLCVCIVHAHACASSATDGSAVNFWTPTIITSFLKSVLNQDRTIQKEEATGDFVEADTLANFHDARRAAWAECVTHMCMDAHAHKHAWTHAFTHARTHAFTHARRLHAHSHARSLSLARSHAHSLACACAHVQGCIPRTHTHARTHTHTHSQF